MMFIYVFIILMMSNSGVSKTTEQSTFTVQIGVLFDPSSSDFTSVNRAFEYALRITNASISVIKIDPIVNFTDITNNYALSESLCYQTEQMVFALVGLGHAYSFDLIESYTQALQMPFIMPSCHRKSDSKRYKYTLCMNPSYIRPIADLILYFRWKRIFYLFDSDDDLLSRALEILCRALEIDPPLISKGLWRLQQLYDELNISKYHLSLVARRILNPLFAHDVLRTVDKIGGCMDNKIIVLDMSHKNITATILRQVIDVGMNRAGYHYIIGGLDIQSYNLSVFRHGGSIITGYGILDNNYKFLKDFRDKWAVRVAREKVPELTVEAALAADGIASLTTALNLIWKNSSVRHTCFRLRRGVYCNTNGTGPCGVQCRSNPLVPFLNGPLILDTLKSVALPGLSGIVSFDKNGHRTGHKLRLYQMGNIKPLESRKLEEVGEWTIAKRLQTKLKRPDIQQSRPESRTKIVTTVMEEPYVKLRTTNSSESNSTYEGYAIDLLDLIVKSKYVDFDYELRPRKDVVYGTMRDNRTWNGMMGEIIDGPADIAIGPITITEERQEFVDFTKPFMKTGISIMIKKPDTQKPGVFSFKEPLSNQIWLCITIGFLAVSLILFLVGRFSPYEWSDNASNDGPSEDFNFLNSLWSSLGALMQQGSDIFPRSISGRVAESAWWFFTLILVSSYTANLAAFLTVENLQIPINSVDDLYNQDKIKYGIKSGGSTETFFKESRVYIYSKMHQKMEESFPSVYVKSNKDGWKRVEQSKADYAFLVESASNEYFNQKKPCKTMKVGENLNNIGYGIVTKKNSELSKWINLAVLELRERGELIKLEQKWWYDKGQCGTGSGDKGKRSLSLSNVSGIFHILIGGLVLAMLIAVCEYILHTKIKRRRKYKLKDKENKQVTRIQTDGKGERQPLRSTNANGAQENKGNCNNPFINHSDSKKYQTSAPTNLITFEGITGNGQTQL